MDDATPEGSSDAVVITTLDHRVLAWSPGAEALCGLPSSAAVGKYFDELCAIDGVCWSFSRAALPEPSSEIIVAVASGLGARRDIDRTLDASEQKRRSVLQAAPTRRAAVELDESDGRYRDLFENAPDGMLFTTEQGVVLDVNRRCAEILGIGRSDLLGKSITSLAHYMTIDAAALLALVTQVWSGTSPLHGVEVACRRADDGRQVFVELSLRVVDRSKQVRGIWINVRDVTGHKRAEQALYDSEAKFRSINECSPMGMHLYALEDDGRLVFEGANPAADRILGVDNHQFIGRTIEEAFPPLTKTDVPNRYRDVAAHGGLWTASQIDYKDGRIVGAFEVYAYQTSPNRMAAMFLDILPRLRAEEALREKTAELDGFFSSARDLLCIADTDGHFRRLNPEWERTLGYRLDELIDKPFLDFVHPDDVEATRARLAELTNQSQVGNSANRYRHKDGSYRWIEWRSFVRGKLIFASGRDVTERKRNEEALLESERLNRMIVEMASDYIFHANVDADGRETIDYVSKSFAEITGLSLDQVRSLEAWAELFHPEDRATAYATLRRIRTEKQPIELQCRATVKGIERWIHVYARPELDGGGQRVVGIMGACKDVTDRRRMELEQSRLREQLQQAMKMEAIGRLAGGVAHDFNNLLTSITGNVELALMDLEASDPLAITLSEVIKAAQSAATLTGQLLAFSRKQLIEPKVLNLNDLVSNLHKMLTRLIGEDIALRLVLGEDLVSVKIDPGQFEQAIINLAVNARDAMPKGGTLMIETANVELGPNYCASHPHVTPGCYAMLAVSDTGMGMTREAQAHIFEPFFTTKPKGKGTGLGLAMTYGTVKQAGGNVEVYSEVGKGSTFKIYLPAVHEKALKWARRDRRTDLPGGQETVLLVEDERLVRDLAKRILERLGYNVISVDNGGEAFIWAETCKERIDLLLTDVVMPGMSGHELAKRLERLHPGMKVLYTSGYTENIIVHHGVVDEGVRFISKPYTAQALARKVRGVLDGKL